MFSFTTFGDADEEKGVSAADAFLKAVSEIPAEAHTSVPEELAVIESFKQHAADFIVETGHEPSQISAFVSANTLKTDDPAVGWHVETEIRVRLHGAAKPEVVAEPAT